MSLQSAKMPSLKDKLLEQEKEREEKEEKLKAKVVKEKQKNKMKNYIIGFIAVAALVVGVIGFPNNQS